MSENTKYLNLIWSRVGVIMGKNKATRKRSKRKSLEDKLTYSSKLSWENVSKSKEKRIFDFCSGYMDFLNRGKTEREAVTVLKELLEAEDFLPIDQVKEAGPGTRFYIENRKKNLAVFILGKRPIREGLNIIASHADSPRLDLKQNPLQESGDAKVALLRTHYYGGVKKYQWANIPLAIHGHVIKADGTEMDIVIGENDSDPVFTITDLLPHLAHKKQAPRKLGEGIKGEELQVLVGSRPVSDKKAKKKIKLWVLDYLNKNYGMVEEDFISSEFEVVPAFKARDIGLDRSLIGAYGQEDRMCAYTSIKAIMDTKVPERSSLILIMDKEEIGSDGPTGMKSRFIMNAIGDALALVEPDYRESDLRRGLQHSFALSADVNAGVNPIFKDVHELQNAARIGHSIIITKFTGSGGKYSSNDANAEFVAMIRNLFNKKRIPWQAAEMGKIDEGGGGTVAKFLAEHNMDVLDCGPGLISMHSPFEISAKTDVYHSYQAYNAFLKMDN